MVHSNIYSQIIPIVAWPSSIFSYTQNLIKISVSHPISRVALSLCPLSQQVLHANFNFCLWHFSLEGPKFTTGARPGMKNIYSLPYAKHISLKTNCHRLDFQRNSLFNGVLCAGCLLETALGVNSCGRKSFKGFVRGRDPV